MKIMKNMFLIMVLILTVVKIQARNDLREAASRIKTNLENITHTKNVNFVATSDIMVSLLSKKPEVYEIVGGSADGSIYVLTIFYNGKNRFVDMLTGGNDEFSICLSIVKKNEPTKEYYFCEREYNGGYYYVDYGAPKESLLINIGACSGYFRIMAPSEAIYFEKLTLNIIQVISQINQ